MRFADSVGLRIQGVNPSSSVAFCACLRLFSHRRLHQMRTFRPQRAQPGETFVAAEVLLAYLQRHEAFFYIFDVGLMLGNSGSGMFGSSEVLAEVER